MRLSREKKKRKIAPCLSISPIIPRDTLRATKPSSNTMRKGSSENSLSNQRECTGINYEISNLIMTSSNEFSYRNVCEGLTCASH